MQLKSLETFAFTASILVASSGVSAHTGFQVNTTDENKSQYTAVAIGHGCESPNATATKKIPVIANSIVWPDGSDSVITNKATGKVLKGAVDDYVSWGGKLSYVVSRDVFDKQGKNYGRNTNSELVGYYSWKGKLDGDQTTGLLPLKISGHDVDPNDDKCVKSVTVEATIADICKRTKFKDINPHTVNIWSSVPDSKFTSGANANLDGIGHPASYTINRVDALPGSCGAGIDIVIRPSGAQVDHDLPIPGVWPK